MKSDLSTAEIISILTERARRAAEDAKRLPRRSDAELDAYSYRGAAKALGEVEERARKADVKS